MNIKEAFEYVKQGKGMRLSKWRKEFIIRCQPVLSELKQETEAVYDTLLENKRTFEAGRKVSSCEKLRRQEKTSDRNAATIEMQIEKLMEVPYLYVESGFGCVPLRETVLELTYDGWEVVD